MNIKKIVLAVSLVCSACALHAVNHPIIADEEGHLRTFCLNCPNKAGVIARKDASGNTYLTMDSTKGYTQIYSGRIIRDFEPGDSLKLTMKLRGSGSIRMGFILSDWKKVYIGSYVNGLQVSPDKELYETVIPVKRREGKTAMEQPAHALVTFQVPKGFILDVLQIDYEVLRAKKEEIELPEI